MIREFMEEMKRRQFWYDLNKDRRQERPEGKVNYILGLVIICLGNYLTNFMFKIYDTSEYC